MKNLSITIKFMADKSHQLEITPAEWLIIPSLKKTDNANRKDVVEFWDRFKNGIDMTCLGFRYNGIGYTIHFLCFKLSIGGFWKLSQVGRVFPSDWGWTNHSRHTNETKRNELTQTGYDS